MIDINTAKWLPVACDLSHIGLQAAFDEMSAYGKYGRILVLANRCNDLILAIDLCRVYGLRLELTDSFPCGAWAVFDPETKEAVYSPGA